MHGLVTGEFNKTFTIHLLHLKSQTAVVSICPLSRCQSRILKTGWGYDVDFQHGIQILAPGSIPWSHGLFMSLVWSLTIGLVAYLALKDTKASWVIGPFQLSQSLPKNKRGKIFGCPSVDFYWFFSGA